MPTCRGGYTGCLDPPAPLPSALICRYLPDTYLPLPPSVLPHARWLLLRPLHGPGPWGCPSFPPSGPVPRPPAPGSLCPEAHLSVSRGTHFPSAVCLWHTTRLRKQAAQWVPRSCCSCPTVCPSATPPGRRAWQQRSCVCPAHQLTSPGTSGSTVVTVSGHAPTHLSTASRNRMKHVLENLGPRPHLELRVWGATRGCAGYTAVHVWAHGHPQAGESTDMGTHTLTYRFAHTHECIHTCTCSHHTHAPTPLPGLCRAARCLPLARISRWGLGMFCVQQPAGGELLGGGRCGGAQTAPSGSPSLHIVPGSRNVCWRG